MRHQGGNNQIGRKDHIIEEVQRHLDMAIDSVTRKTVLSVLHGDVIVSVLKKLVKIEPHQLR